MQLKKELMNHSANAGGASLSGVIMDASTHAPLPAATIYLPDLKKGAIADDKGFFKIVSLPAGKHTIEISYQGYATDIETIEVNGDITLNFSLKPSYVEREGVTVTGVSSAARTRQSPQPVAVIKRTDFINTTATNTIDALTKLVPGFNAVSTGPAVSKPFIRGLGYNRVLTINDGVKQEGQQWGDEHGIEIDDYSVQRVEVLKGPASLMYGSDAIAGVINIQSQLPAPEGTLKINALSEYQSNNNLRGFYGNIGGTKKGFSWNAYGSYKGAEDYQNKYDGYVFNSKFYNKNFGGMLGYNGSWGYSHLFISNFDQHLGIVEGERDSVTGAFIKVLPGDETAISTGDDFKKINPEIPFQHIRHFKITSDNNYKIGSNNLDVVAGYQHNQRQEFGNADNPSVANAWFNLQTMSYAVRWHFAYKNNWRTSAGITGMYQTNENKAEEVIIPNYDLFEAGAFVFTRYSKDKLTISGGLRFDNRHVNGKQMKVDGEPKFNSFSKNFSNISGSAGFSYEFTKAFALKAN
ncbi:MAG TPA: TonB-dependent receptor plug domain-containing protein, partial [Chitinophagaceae bacterium]|nr:TonB-dependent receptor plug domain-containing protein [Chitinophagaceae bacterium]